MKTTRDDKETIRQAADLIRKFGLQVEATVLPDGKKEVRDLPGAGRLTVTQAGLRNKFLLEASAAEFELSCYRGQIESCEIKKGSAQDVERVSTNAQEIAERIKSENEVQRKAKIAAAPTGFHAYR